MRGETGQHAHSGAGSAKTTRSHWRFAQRRGFEEVGREFEVVLDLTKVDHLAASRRPVSSSSRIAERPDLIQAVFEVDAEVAPDMPPPAGPEPRADDVRAVARRLSRGPRRDA